MKLPQPNGLTGKLLIASPKLKSDVFTQSVVYMIGHDELGAAGLIVNQLAPNLTMDDLYLDFNISKPNPFKKVPVYFGGPVDVNMGLVIHTPTPDINNSVLVSDDLAISACHDFLNQATSDKKPDHFLVTLGYASWTSGQLEKEMMDSDWLTLDAHSNIIFATENEQKWAKSIDLMKANKTIHSHQTGMA
jgi:putative transcriptional regulator